MHGNVLSQAVVGAVARPMQGRPPYRHILMEHWGNIAQDGAARAMIEVRDLTYEYPSKRALDGVSLRVAPQTIVALVGPNGAGKTTLLRCLAALSPPYAGAVSIDGLDTGEA